MKRPLRVLLIEDNPEDEALVRLVLDPEFENLELIYTSDEPSFRETFDRVTVEAVITDHNIPGTDGFQILAYVKSRRPECPVIMCTGTGTEEIAARGILDGLDAYVLKRNYRQLPGILKKVLEQSELREELRQTKERFERLLRISPAVIYSAQIGEDFPVTFISPNVEKQLGYPPSDFIGDPKFRADRILPADRERLDAAVERALQAESAVAEYRMKAADGEHRWIRDEFRIVRNGSGPTEIAGYWLDISEQKDLELRLCHAQKMEAVHRLAGGVAHDFNNLLTVVLGYADLLLAQVHPTDPLYPPIEAIGAAGRRGAALTRQLLAVSRRQPMRFRVTDLNGIVTSMKDMLTRLIGEQIQLDVQTAPAPVMVNVDTGQIEQVILNLAVNARDAMPDGGRLAIWAQHVPAGEKQGSWVRLIVSDTGIGMSAETQERIFEPFFTTKAELGTGLGLATVYGIVEQSNGEIRVRSAPGKGTAFEVDLRTAAPGARAEQTVDVPKPARGGSETILLVEDEDAVRAVTANMLRMRGFKVIDCRNAGEALLVCERADERIDLMLTDVIMPFMSGPQLVDRLAKLRPGMKIVYMSGYSGDASVHPEADPSIEFLAKPFTPDMLVTKIQSALARASGGSR